MNKVLLSIITTMTLFGGVNQDLLKYQKDFTLCKGTTNYEIASCFLNSTVDYSKGRADNLIPLKINKEDIKKAEENNNEYEFILNNYLPDTKRYIELEKYLNYLYSKEDIYEKTNFKKFEKFNTRSENIRKTRKILNIFLKIDLKDTDLFDNEMKRALVIFQKNHGFEPNGRLWKETRDELNKSFDKIILKIKKNLELERSVNYKEGRYIYINIPEFKMYYFIDNEEVLSMNIIVGKKYNRTPIFTENLKYVVENPRWNVPASIYNKEYSHWSNEKIKQRGFAFDSEGKLYQKPGKRNALGLVKFLFPNSYNVYMHDTPNKKLFKKRIRTFSHGCIRLEKPFKLLNILGFEYEKDKTKWNTLKETIPVHIEYHTAWIDNNGDLNFRNDIYGYEKTLF